MGITGKFMAGLIVAGAVMAAGCAPKEAKLDAASMARIEAAANKAEAAANKAEMAAKSAADAAQRAEASAQKAEAIFAKGLRK